MILDRIVEATKVRVKKSMEELPLEELQKKLKKNENPFCFEKALQDRGMSFICEVKKASPSKGLLAPHFPFVEIAQDYEEGGATAISVLTEPDFFQGSNEYLKEIRKNVGIPLLRKDFTITPYQIYEASLLGADAILLICALLDTKTLEEYLKIADSLGLSCLVEAHDQKEVESALEAGARVIGVNNRDLKTFEVDLDNSINLRKLVPEEVIFISESGIRNRDDIRRLEDNGVNGVLIGETLMRQENKKQALDVLKGEGDE